VIRVLLTERITKTAENLPPDTRDAVSKAVAAVAAAFGDPHKHRGPGLRKLAKRSYEVRVQRQWRVVFIHEGENLIAYDIMNRDEVSLWLRGRRK
jgi:hypothetical protein